MRQLILYIYLVFSFAWKGIVRVPGRGSPGPGTGACCYSLHWPRPRPDAHSIAPRGWAGDGDAPLDWRSSPQLRRGTQNRRLTGTRPHSSPLPLAPVPLTSRVRVGGRILLSPPSTLPPTPSPRQWGAFVCNFAASGCRMFLGKRCSEYAVRVCLFHRW